MADETTGNAPQFEPDVQAALDKSGAIETPTLQDKIAAQPLRRVKRVGETEGPDTYQTGINFLDEIHNVDLLTNEEYELYQQEESRVTQMMRALSATKDAGAGQQLIKQIKATREKLAESVLKRKLKGIGGNGSRSSEWRSMLFHDKVALMTAIVAKSQLGEDFAERL